MPGHASATACTDLAILPGLHRVAAERIHLPPVAEAGTHHRVAVVEAGSHPEVAADSFREAVDSSLSAFSLLRDSSRSTG